MSTAKRVFCAACSEGVAGHRAVSDGPLPRLPGSTGGPLQTKHSDRLRQGQGISVPKERRLSESLRLTSTFISSYSFRVNRVHNSKYYRRISPSLFVDHVISRLHTFTPHCRSS